MAGISLSRNGTQLLQLFSDRCAIYFCADLPFFCFHLRICTLHEIASGLTKSLPNGTKQPALSFEATCSIEGLPKQKPMGPQGKTQSMTGRGFGDDRWLRHQFFPVGSP